MGSVLVQQYKPLIDEQGRLLGKKGKVGAPKDREVVQSSEMAIKAFRRSPQGFNGPLGFGFFEWIDHVKPLERQHQRHERFKLCPR